MLRRIIPPTTYSATNADAIISDDGATAVIKLRLEDGSMVEVAMRRQTLDRLGSRIQRETKQKAKPPRPL
jgi:hypothetical protein